MRMADSNTCKASDPSGDNKESLSANDENHHLAGIDKAKNLVKESVENSNNADDCDHDKSCIVSDNEENSEENLKNLEKNKSQNESRGEIATSGAKSNISPKNSLQPIAVNDDDDDEIIRNSNSSSGRPKKRVSIETPHQQVIREARELELKRLKQLNDLSDKMKPNASGDNQHEVTIYSKTTNEIPANGWVRHVIAILALSSILVANMTRQSFNQALIQMTNTSSPNSVHWNDKQTDSLKSSFSLGYALFMVPVSRLCEVFGTKWIVFFCGFGSATATLVVPIFGHNDLYTLTLISRFLMGVSQTAVSPALYAILSRWLSDDESSLYLPLLKSGVMFGLLLGTVIAALPSWEMCFYVSGAIALVWSALWAFFVTSLPNENKFISPNELRYIVQELEKRDGKKPKATEQEQKLLNDTPNSRMDAFMNVVRQEAQLSKKILLNWPVIAVMLTKWTLRLSTDFQTQFLAQFFDKVHHLSKQDNSMVNSINYAIQCVLTFHVVYLSRLCNANKAFGLNKTGIRRLFQSGCSFGMTIALLIPTLNMESLNLALSSVVLLSITNTLCAGADSMLPYDLSPTYSATIMGVANSFANLAGVMLPLLVTEVLGDERTNLDLWRYLLYIVSALMAVGGIIFLVVVKAKIQPFDPAYRVSNKKQKYEIPVAREAIEMPQLSGQKSQDPEIKNDIEIKMKKEEDCSSKKVINNKLPPSFKEWRNKHGVKWSKADAPSDTTGSNSELTKEP